MTENNFDTIVKEKFKFLETEFDFLLKENKKESWGYRITYNSDATAVRIIYEYREAYLHIILYRLKNGKLIENPNSIGQDSVLYGFGLDDVLFLRNPDSIVKPAYEYGDNSKYYGLEGLSLYVSLFAENLKSNARDILIGDFTIFPDLDKIVKKRAKKYS